jgi:hypothetical protein
MDNAMIRARHFAVAPYTLLLVRSGRSCPVEKARFSKPIHYIIVFLLQFKLLSI